MTITWHQASIWLYYLLYRTIHAGPGLAIRVICQSAPRIHDDFSPTNSLLAHIVTFYHACRQSSSPVTASVEKLISKDERDFLLRLTEHSRISATLLPIYSVGVQVSARKSEAGKFIQSYLVCPWFVIACLLSREMQGHITMWWLCPLRWSSNLLGLIGWNWQKSSLEFVTTSIGQFIDLLLLLYDIINSLFLSLSLLLFLLQGCVGIWRHGWWSYRGHHPYLPHWRSSEHSQAGWLHR